MEGFLSFLIILGIILRFVGKSVKPGKTNKPGPRAQMPAAPQPAPAPAAPQSVPMPDISWLCDEEECEGPFDTHTHAEGASHADAQGCVGGSMAHSTHEGRGTGASMAHDTREGRGTGASMAHDTREGRSAAGAVPGASAEGRSVSGIPAAILQAKPEGPGNIAAKASAEPEKVQPLVQRPRIGAKELRRAVITSEILREPLALRGRIAGR